jgi:hypothetical protein
MEQEINVPSEAEGQHLPAMLGEGLEGTGTDAFTKEEWLGAAAMSLRCDASSVEAIGLVEGIFETLEFPAAQKILKPSTVERRRKALRALMADLLRHAADGVAGFHGTSPKDFPSRLLGFGRDVFMPLKDAMVAGGWLDFAPGHPRWNSMDNFETGQRGDVVQRGGYKARFRLTRKALDAVEAAGIALDAWADHWTLPEAVQGTGVVMKPVGDLVELRGRKERVKGHKVDGDKMAVNMEDAVLQPILADLKAHNALLAAVGVSGVDFIGLRRIFNDGGEPGFAWNKGGRFYSLRAEGMDKPYEMLNGDQRRKRIRLGGEKVGEVDMSASQLRILYALLNEEIPAGLSDDLYALPGAPREAVKLVIAQALGKDGSHSKRWGQAAAKAYAKQVGKKLQAQYPFIATQEVALTGHPILQRLGTPDCPTALGLQYVESEVVRAAMALLRQDGIPSLPVHDSLIVPLGKLENAEAALREAFSSVISSMLNAPTAIQPRMSRKGAPAIPEEPQSIRV